MHDFSPIGKYIYENVTLYVIMLRYTIWNKIYKQGNQMNNTIKLGLLTTMTGIGSQLPWLLYLFR